MSGESHSVFCKTIQVRGRKLTLAIAAQIPIPQVISKYVYNIRRGQWQMLLL